ncbi:MAG: hypothetical protein JRJ84_08050 [Deltaproteobacteria bacterium]|nr:hypothetical protein [Deltaproteobacteria bacterium]
MDPHEPKASSVRQDGEPDDFCIGSGFWGERDPGGTTRLVVSVPPERLGALHQVLVGALQAPLGLLYRQVVDRRNPRPQGAPPRDQVALELPTERVLAVLQRYAPLVYHDARGEYWLRGALGEQIVLDGDGLLFCYPDDPAFRDVLEAAGLAEGKLETLQDRDYVKHCFHAECDALEDRMVSELGLTEVVPRKG